MTIRRSSIAMLIALACASSARAAPSDSFAIHVVDDATNRGVPLVELETTFHARYFTDSAGYVAFTEPGLLTGDDVWFDVRSYGYESPSGALDMPGVALKPSAGKTAEIRLKRTNIAERLYRTTGYGIYRDSVLLGLKVPIKESLLNAKVCGQDTVQTAIYKGKYYWLWGDTDRLGYSLGCFAMTGATAALPDKLDPDAGIDFTYFVDKPGEFARAMAHVEREGSNPIWVDGLTVVKDEHGQERMLARYAAVDKSMKTIESGLLLFNDEAQRFERFKQFKGDGMETLAPCGRPYYGVDADAHYVYYPGGIRVRADFLHALDPSQYESFTCMKSHGVDTAVERLPDGRPNWRWERGAPHLTQDRLEVLVKLGELKRDELPVDFREVRTGKHISLANGSIAWSRYLKCWTYLFGETHGDSNVGEIWFATADSPDGPWRDAVKIATHAMPQQNNDFYNPIQHDELQRGDGRYVYFEGTFVNTFSGNPWPTPYYNYNNIMYRIDLSDPRLALPKPMAGWTRVSPE